MLQDISLIPLQPPIWAKTAHLQTIWGDKLPSPKVNRKSYDFWVTLSDRDRLFVKEFAPTEVEIQKFKSRNPEAKLKLVILAHGLSGNSEAGYMQRIASHCLERGYRPVLMNHRNCGESFGTSRGTYHSGRGDDIAAVVGALRKRWPNHEITVVGFSMSGNALLRLVAEHMGPEPDRAIAVNAPINLAKSSDLINQGFSRLYEINFLLSFKDLLERKSRKGLIDTKYPVKPLKMSIRDFDNLYTGPRGGFGLADDYYRMCSTYQKLNQIQVDTTILTAADDPFIAVEDFVEAKKTIGTAPVRIHIEPCGGHLGYIHNGKTPLGTNRWMDYAIMTLLQS